MAEVRREVRCGPRAADPRAPSPQRDFRASPGKARRWLAQNKAKVFRTESAVTYRSCRLVQATVALGFYELCLNYATVELPEITRPPAILTLR